MATCAEKTMVKLDRRTRRVVAVTVLTTVVMLAAALVVAFRHTDSASPESFREMPLTVAAKVEAISLLSDDDLRVLVDRVRPSWERPRVSALIHCLRLWGVDAEFGLPAWRGPRGAGFRPAIPSPMAGWKPGPQVLCDDEAFQAAFGPGPSFLMWQRDGLATRQALDDRAAAHVDDLLAAAAEARLPLSTPMLAGGGAGTLRDLLRGAIARFEIGQELEFTAVALAAYLPPVKSWTNRRGETFTFDDVARKLLEPATPKQACYGTHVPYALAFLARIDEIEPILAAGARSDVIARLQRLSGDLESRQDGSGAWVPERIQRDPLDPTFRESRREFQADFAGRPAAA